MENQIDPEKKFMFMYNDSFGGYRFSKFAMEKYYELNPNTNVRHSSDIRRDDELMISIVKEYGDKTFGEYAQIKIAEFPYKLRGYIRVHEYDGKESLDVEVYSYTLDRIRDVVSSENTADKKINEIIVLLKNNLDNCISYGDF